MEENLFKVLAGVRKQQKKLELKIEQLNNQNQSRFWFLWALIILLFDKMTLFLGSLITFFLLSTLVNSILLQRQIRKLEE